MVFLLLPLVVVVAAATGAAGPAAAGGGGGRASLLRHTTGLDTKQLTLRFRLLVLAPAAVRPVCLKRAQWWVNRQCVGRKLLDAPPSKGVEEEQYTHV